MSYIDKWLNLKSEELKTKLTIFTKSSCLGTKEKMV